MAECGATLDEFTRTGRTGRRNALPDVLAVQHANVTTAGLPEVLEKFNLGSSGQPGQNAASAKDSEAQTKKMG